MSALSFAKYAVGESILDKPRVGLDPAVWAVNADGEYVPTIQAS